MIWNKYYPRIDMKGGSRRAQTNRRTRRGGWHKPFLPLHGGRKKVAMTNRRTKKGGYFSPGKYPGGE